MNTHTIKKGFDIRLAGRPEPRLEDAPEPLRVAVDAAAFPGVKCKVLVKEGERVRTGQPLFFDKRSIGAHFVAPATGKVTGVVLGARRALQRIEIVPEANDEWHEGARLDPRQLGTTPREKIVAALQQSGLWPLLRQRPVGKMADPAAAPVAIYVNGMDTEPLAADPGFAVQGRGEGLTLGVALLRALTKGRIHLTLRAGAAHPPEFRNLRDVEMHEFAGPHPAGLVGTHIARIAPLHAGEVVWYLKAQELAALGEWVASGRYPTHRVVAVAGTAAPKAQYFRVRDGAALLTLTGGKPLAGDVRLINGTVLSGTAVEPDGYLGCYAQTLTIIPQGAGRRDLFGWALPQVGKHSASRAVFSWLAPKAAYDLDARIHGGVRAIVNIGQWESVMPLDIHPTFLVRAIQAGDLEEAINLGLLEVTEEDVALCSFVDPCKIEVGAIIRRGLDLYEKEG
jgi:Na+-transporting NADH:ubiquinone oxidoreductase subunit A